MSLASALSLPRPWLVLPVETNVRELHARILLAAVAAEAGFSVGICRLADLGIYLPLLPRSIVLQTNVVSDEISRFARDLGHTLIALDEEGLVQRDWDDYSRRRISIDALQRVEKFFAWGDEQRAAIIAKAPALQERIVSVGNPRMDLLRPELRRVYEYEAKALSKEFGRFVLINTNFSSFNHHLGVDHRIKEWEAGGWRSSTKGVEILSRTLEFQGRLLEEFCDFIQHLAERLPSDVRIVLRPHPSERFETWSERLPDLQTLRVVHRGSAVPWLMAAEALIHNSCTTGIEAVLLGTPSFAYMPVRDEVAESPLPNRASRTVNDRDILVELILSILVDPLQVEVSPSREVLDGVIGNLDGEWVSDSIIRHLLSMGFPSPSSLDLQLVRWGSIRNRLLRRGRSFASALRRRDFRTERNLVDYVRKASPGIDVHEVKDVLGRLASVCSRFGDLRCVEVARDLVLIRSEEPDPGERLG